jgi:predicted TPR repeat methyltransferase
MSVNCGRIYSGTLGHMFKRITKAFAKKPQSIPACDAQHPVSSSSAHTELQQLGAAHKDHGDECFGRGALDEAAEYYRQAIAAHPGFAEAHTALGDLLRRRGRWDEAIRCYRSAIEFAPEGASAHYGMGVAFVEKLDLQNAKGCFEKALDLNPDFASAHSAMGFILLQSGRPADALTRFKRTVSIDPANGMALHMIASLTGANPERAPRQYVEKLFDGFADTFDADLRSLKYESPKDLAGLTAQYATPNAGKWRVLDLGCGTGLVGLEIAPYASQLVGVDLSVKMLEKAQARNLYHRLECADLVTMMQGEKSSSYDIVISADTFIYVGKLDDVVREVKRLLCPGGFFAFSVEALEAVPNANLNERDALGYRLQETPSCRYAHSLAYVSRLASDNDLKIRESKAAHLRMSNGKSIKGYLVLMEN